MKVNCNLEMEFAGCRNYNVSKCGFAAAFPDMVVRNRICNSGEISHTNKCISIKLCFSKNSYAQECKFVQS